VHPIERLRYVARASGAEQGVLVRETAHALASFGDDPTGLVTACRRIIDRHPSSGPLWWLCARVLTGEDPIREAWGSSDAVDADATAVELAHAIPDAATACVVGWPELVGEALVRRGDVDVLVIDAFGEGHGLVRRLEAAGTDAVDVPSSGIGAAVEASDVVLLESTAMGPGGFVGVAGSLAAAAVARHANVPVWVTAGVGRLLPLRMWDALLRRRDEHMRDDPWDAEEEVVALDLVDRIAGPAGVVAVDAALRRIDCPIAPELFRRADR
jgi:hypothetical protein